MMSQFMGASFYLPLLPFSMGSPPMLPIPQFGVPAMVSPWPQDLTQAPTTQGSQAPTTQGSQAPTTQDSSDKESD